MISFGQISNSSKDDKQFPVQQVTSNGKNSDVTIMLPYGFHANMSVETLVTLLALGGDTSNTMAIGGHTEYRPKLKSGEVAVFHPDKKQEIIFKEDGNIFINALDKDLQVEAKTLDAKIEKVSIKNDTAELIDLISQLNKAVSEITTPTITGPQAPINKPIFEALQPKIDSFKA